MKRTNAWMSARALDNIGVKLAFVWLAAALVFGSATGEAFAEGAPAKPTAPKNIDQTPPLVPIPGARVSATGLLVGGQPSPAQWKAIQEAGYRTVISLRTESETGDEGDAATVERLGMKFVSIPVAVPAGLTEANARSLDSALGAEDALPAVVYCLSGQRSAALIGLEAFVVDRISPARAIDLARGLGLKKLEGALRERISAICKADPSRNCEGMK